MVPKEVSPKVNTVHFPLVWESVCLAFEMVSNLLSWITVVALLSIAWRLAEERTELWGAIAWWTVDDFEGESHAFENYLKKVLWYPMDNLHQLRVLWTSH